VKLRNPTSLNGRSQKLFEARGCGSVAKTRHQKVPVHGDEPQGQKLLELKTKLGTTLAECVYTRPSSWHFNIETLYVNKNFRNCGLSYLVMVPILEEIVAAEKNASMTAVIDRENQQIQHIFSKLPMGAYTATEIPWVFSVEVTSITPEWAAKTLEEAKARVDKIVKLKGGGSNVCVVTRCGGSAQFHALH